MATSGATADFISDLPGGITADILQRLPLQEAVRTSILSKNWRYKWKARPQLRFGSLNFSSPSKSRSELLTIIHQVLLQQQGPITVFNLALHQLGTCPEIDHFISILSTESIERFVLSVGEAHIVPTHIFSFQNMWLFALFNCVLKPPTEFPGFAKLSALVLRFVDLPDSFAETFVAKCPLLWSLSLRDCTNLDRIDFNAPKLKKLEYQGGISSISFKNTPSLTNISIKHGDRTVSTLSWTPNTWINTLCSLPSLMYLQLGPLMLSAGIDLDILPRKLNCLKTLELSVCFRSTLATRLTLSLIKGSPNLQKLVIELSSPTEEDNGLEIQISKLKESSSFSKEKLQYVEMSSFSGLSSHIALIELLLAKSPMLETMHIYHLKKWSRRKRVKIRQLPCASPRAKLTFSTNLIKMRDLKPETPRPTLHSLY